MDFSVERALVGATGVLATFDYGLNGIQTACHFAAEPTDEIYAVKGPKAFRHYEGKLQDLPEPALVVRRHGETWSRPFVVLYETYGNGVEKQIASVSVTRGKALEITVRYRQNPKRYDMITIEGKNGLTVRAYKGEKLIDDY